VFRHLAIPLAIAVLGLAAWDDYRRSKIRNRYIILGVLGASAFHAASVALDFAPPPALLNALLSGIVALIAGAGFWYFGMWSAGDAKLYAVTAMLLPTGMYLRDGWWMPSYVILTNAFVFIFAVAMCWFTGGLFRKYVRGEGRGGVMPADFTMMDAVAGVLGFMVVLAFRRLVFDLVLGNISGFMAQERWVYIIMFLMMRVIAEFFRRKPLLYFALAVVAAYASWSIYHERAAAIIPLLKMTTISIVLMVLRILYEWLIKDMDEKTIPAGELRPGMILTKGTVVKHELQGIIENSDAGYLMPDGLTESQATEVLKALNARGDKEIEVQRTSPFAIFMLLGYLATVILGGTPQSWW
jgi:Flp pilus assembly protein protease CpaA